MSDGGVGSPSLPRALTIHRLGTYRSKDLLVPEMALQVNGATGEGLFRVAQP